MVIPFRERPLEGEHPYVWLDALYPKVRQHHRIVSMALVIAIGVRATGEREILGFEVGASEEAAFWQSFLRHLVARGLSGVQLVISDAHQGLKEAITTAFAGASWQRCRVHFMRNVLAHITKGNRSMVAAALRTIFAQPDRESAGEQLLQVVAGLNATGSRQPRSCKMRRTTSWPIWPTHPITGRGSIPLTHWSD